MMAQPRKASLLKLSLPGVDPATIPILSPEQVDQTPAELLSFLHNYGRVDDYGDLKIITVKDGRHNFTILSIAEWVANGSLEHGEFQVEQPELMGLEAIHRPVAYKRSTHEQDTTFVATAETHARFLQRLGLYMFSIRAGMPELQAHVRDTICTQYPVYEAELIALLTTIFDHTDNLKRFDPTLSSFVNARMRCLRELLVKHEAILPLLCKVISAKDRFLSLAGRADHDVMAHALAELRRGVGEVVETEALLDTFIEQNSTDADTSQPVQHAHMLPTAIPTKRKRGRPSKAEVEAKAAESSASSTAGMIVKKEAAAMPRTNDTRSLATSSTSSDAIREGDEAAYEGLNQSHGHPRTIGASAGSLSTNEVTENLLDDTAADELVPVVPASSLRAKRPHPGKALWTAKEPGLTKPKLRLKRPQSDNEYWSVTPQEWHALTVPYQRAYTHAGVICETEAGMMALEPCSACRAAGHVCEVYTNDARNTYFGESCARCRLKYDKKCSHASRGSTNTAAAEK
jgi:hypothetical protein